MMMENESIGSEKARDGPLHHHHSHDVRVVTSTKKCPSPVKPSTNSTDQNPAQFASSSETTEEKEKGHGEENLSKEPSDHPSQEEERNNAPCPDAPNDLQIVGNERTMTTSTTNTNESESHVEQSFMITPAPKDTLNSALKIQDSISSDEFMRSPKVQNAIVERSPEGRYVRFLEKLGSGASKDVYRAYDTQEGIEVAWNVVQLSGVPKLERNRIVNEVRLLERLHHPNIISFHGSWVNRERQEVNFVTEILSSGTLSKFIAKVQVIRWKIAKRWATQILKGLEYLHSQDPPVIHRDLKCENIFINGTSGDLRIGDLGLSTVHSTGKVLSVLGTPEFMAPDLYEESPYDEKVDIYAFGMCLLEILTKETPYRECSNPAQIYKKVMKGDRPESLQRLRSKMARDFITLCLGFRDEASGKYTRPSASELLKHQFLFKSKNDDSEVIVDPPLQERTIVESPTLASHKVSVEEGAMLDEVPLPLSRPRNSDSTVDCESDEFEEMPDSEINIKKVKVMMGRNEELKEDENERLSNAQMASSDSNPSSHVSAKLASSVITADNIGFQNESQKHPPTSQVADSTEGTTHSSIQTFPTNDTQGFSLLNSNSSMHHVQTSSSIPSTSSALSNASNQLQKFLVSTSVVEDVSAAMPHYQDDILKLIVTLPVDGQQQNVQFDFHLVEDDPVEVAREMVSELGIPLEATLEIGGTISALAREARIKQGQHRKQQQIPQTVVAANAPISLGHENPGATSMYQSQQSSHIVQTQQMFQAQPPSQIVQPQHKQFISAVNDSTPATNEFLDGNSIYQPHQIVQSQQPQRVGTATIPTVENDVTNPTHQAHHSTQFVHTQPNTNAAQPISMSHENPNSNQTFQSQQAPQAPQVAQPQSVHGPGTVQRQVSSATPPPPSLPTEQDPVHMTSMQSIASENHVLASQQSKPSLQSFLQTPQHMADEVNLYETNAETAELPELIIDNQSGRLPYQSSTINTDMSELTLSDPSNDNEIMQLINDKLNLDEEDEGMTEELKRLHDHFHKDLLRAEKVHDIRMDNLRRAKLEKEQRHIQTLEKHEKEKMQFEKRVQQEAEEQSKRLEKIQLKYKSERQKLVEKNKQGGSVSTSSSPTQDMFDPNPEIL